MKRKRFTEEQIISILKEHEAGMRVPDLVRKYNVSEQSIYRWKSSCGEQASLARAGRPGQTGFVMQRPLWRRWPDLRKPTAAERNAKYRHAGSTRLPWGYRAERVL